MRWELVDVSCKAEDLHELDPRSFLIVEVQQDRPGVLGEILELFTRSARAS